MWSVEARFKPSIRVGHFFFAAEHSFHLARTKACRSNVGPTSQQPRLPDDHDKDDVIVDGVDNVGGGYEVGELTKAGLVCRGGVGGVGGDSRTGHDTGRTNWRKGKDK